MLAAAVTMTAAACNGPLANPLSGLSVYQIVKKAVANTKAAPDVRIVSSASNSGQVTKMDLSVVRGKGCTGTLFQSGVGSFKIIYSGSTVWVMPSKSYLRAALSHSNGATVALLAGKWLKVKAGSSGLGLFSASCSVSTALGSAARPSSSQPISGGSTSVMNGQNVVELTDEGVKLYITEKAEPRLVSVKAGRGTTSFSYPAAPASIAPPPASQVVDAAKYGL